MAVKEFTMTSEFSSNIMIIKNFVETLGIYYDVQ